MSARATSAAIQGQSSISVLVANDQPILRDGLRAILDGQQDMRVVACVHDGGEAVREAERHCPRVALLGSAQRGLNDGIEAARAIAGRSPAIGVLLLSVHSAPAAVQSALSAGALGFLSFECSGDELVAGVRAVASGSRYLSHGLAEKMLDHRRGAGRAAESLTATERRILKLVAEGESNPAVAKVLGLSPRTVETYRLRLMRKLGVENLASLVRYAIRYGITPLD